MASQNLNKSVVAIRDQLGNLDNVNPVGVWDYDEEIGIEEGPARISKRNIGTAFILGHPANAILGTSALGAGTYGSLVPQRVVNPDNVFHDHFRDTNFEGTSSTATWDTTNYRWEFISGDEGKTSSLFLNQQSISSVLPNLNIEGISVTVKIDTTANPGGVTKNVT